MPERNTLDIDLLIHPDTWPTIQAALEAAGAVLQGTLTVGGYSYKLGDQLVDILLADDPWVKRAIASPNVQNGLPVIALEYLILMKMRASRAIDLGDLSRMLGCASEEELARIRATIKRYAPEEASDLESLIQLGRLEMS
jgi:hypothetical protein